MRKRRAEINTPIHAVLIPDLFGTQLVWSPGYSRLFDSDPDRLIRWPNALLRHRSGREPTQKRLAQLLRSQNLKAGRVIGQFGVEWYGEEVDDLAEESGFAPVGARLLKAGYDWRQAPATAAMEVDKAVRSWVPPDAILFVLAHGYGGLVYRELRSQAEPPAWLKQVGFVAFLGTPHHGAPASLGWVNRGHGMSIFPPLAARTLSNDVHYPFARVLAPVGQPAVTSTSCSSSDFQATINPSEADGPERCDVEIVNVVSNQYWTPDHFAADRSELVRLLSGDGFVPYWSGTAHPGHTLLVDEPHRALIRSQRLWNAIQKHCDLRGLSLGRVQSERLLERRRGRRQLQIWLALERENGSEGETLAGCLLPVGMLSTAWTLLLTPVHEDGRSPIGLRDAWEKSTRLPLASATQGDAGLIYFETPPLPRAPFAALRVLARHPVDGRFAFVDEVLISVRATRAPDRT